MKILHVTRQFYPAIGGIESVVSHLGRAQVKLGHQVDVVTLNRLWGSRETLPKDEWLGELHIHRIPYTGMSKYALAPGVLKLVQPYDIVHLHSSDFFLDYLAFTRAFHKKPLVYHTHGLYFHSKYAKGIKKIYLQTVTRLALNQVSAVICVSKHDLEILKGVTSGQKLHLIPNGVNITSTTTAGAPREPGLIISVGRLSDNKRVHLLLEAFGRVHPKVNGARLVLIGKDQGQAAGLRNLADRLGIAERTVFMGEVPEEKLHEMLGTASVWVTASEYESFGIALLEGMGSGCIPVAQHLDAFEDFLADGQNGFFADFANPDLSAEVIVRALQMDEETRRRFIQCGWETSQRFRWDNIAVSVDGVYHQVLRQMTANESR